MKYRKRKGKKGRRWRKHKVEGRPIGKKEQEKRDVKKEEQYSDILEKLTSIGDPYENMDMLTKKTHALHLFYSEMKVGEKCYMF